MTGQKDWVLRFPIRRVVRRAALFYLPLVAAYGLFGGRWLLILVLAAVAFLTFCWWIGNIQLQDILNRAREEADQ